MFKIKLSRVTDSYSLSHCTPIYPPLSVPLNTWYFESGRKNSDITHLRTFDVKWSHFIAAHWRDWLFLIDVIALLYNAFVIVLVHIARHQLLQFTCLASWFHLWIFKRLLEEWSISPSTLMGQSKTSSVNITTIDYFFHKHTISVARFANYLIQKFYRVYQNARIFFKYYFLDNVFVNRYFWR